MLQTELENETKKQAWMSLSPSLSLSFIQHLWYVVPISEMTWTIDCFGMQTASMVTRQFFHFLWRAKGMWISWGSILFLHFYYSLSLHWIRGVMKRLQSQTQKGDWREIRSLHGQVRFRDLLIRLVFFRFKGQDDWPFLCLCAWLSGVSIKPSDICWPWRQSGKEKSFRSSLQGLCTHTHTRNTHEKQAGQTTADDMWKWWHSQCSWRRKGKLVFLPISWK